MNLERFTGICMEISGRLYEAWGDATGDPMRAAEGRRTQILAMARQRKAFEREQSARQLREFLQRNRNWHF